MVKGAMRNQERWEPGKEHGLVATHSFVPTEDASRETRGPTREGVTQTGSKWKTG